MSTTIYILACFGVVFLTLILMAYLLYLKESYVDRKRARADREQQLDNITYMVGCLHKKFIVNKKGVK